MVPPMVDVLGYQGASVVVTGAACGMGAATAQILVELGATVTAMDIKPTPVPVARFIEVDLRDPAAIECSRRLDRRGGQRPVQLRRVARAPVLGARHDEASTSSALDTWPSSSYRRCPRAPRSRPSRRRPPSGGGTRWRRSGRCLQTKGFDEAVAWLEANDEKWSWSGYLFSKWVVDAWVGYLVPGPRRPRASGSTASTPGPPTRR